jgi:hypothetical protein
LNTLTNKEAMDRLMAQPQVQQAKILQYVEDGITSERQLKELLLLLKEPIIGTKVICGKPDHTSTFQFLYEVITGLVLYFILWGNRSGSKSYLAGFTTWFLSSHFKQLETCILGGSESQSKKSYKAMIDFWRISNLWHLLVKEPMMTETIWKNGSSVSILTASQTSVRGPHSQRLILDEVDEMDFDIFDAALSIPQSKYDLPSSVGIYSTNHNVGGTMDKVLKIAEEKGGYKVYKHCVWECIESCKGYSCSTCPLSSLCPGPQVKEADGYYKIADLIYKLQTMSMDTFQREWSCEKIGRDDLVYGAEFDEDLHCPLSLPAFKTDDWVYLSIDWGGTDPFSVGAWQFFKDIGWVRIDEVYIGNTTNPRVIAECKTRPWWANVMKSKDGSGGVADPSRADLRGEWAAEGIGLEPADNDIDTGVEAVKGALRPIIGNPRIYINRKCKNSRREMLSYCVKNGKIVDKFNHAPDEIRYFVKWKIKPTSEACLITDDQDIRPE